MKALHNGTNPSPALLTTNATFVASQLPALRAALALLRPKLSSLPSSLGNVDWDTKSEERRRYVEEQTKKHLERVQGIDLEQRGGSRDRGGGNDGLGRRIPSEQVEALEGFVGDMHGQEEKMEE